MSYVSPIDIGNAVALSLWKDTRDDTITRDAAARVAERWQAEGAAFPVGTTPDWQQGWQMACETIALALRFKA